MEERSIRVIDSNKTFFGKLSSTLSKIIIPTKIGINGIVINLKRNNLLKAFENNINFKEKTDEEKKHALDSKYQEAYSLYLEAIDKYIMDSVYKKVKTNTASDFEKEAMGNYYKITQIKETDYNEYKYQKQKYLIELDYESLKLNAKEKTIKKYNEFYITQMDSFYKGILKCYSVKLAEVSRSKGDNKLDIYNKIFDTLDEYVEKIITLKLADKENNIEEKIGTDLHRLDQFDIGTLDAKDYVEKNMILLGISRSIFTHSLPLVATEQCYNKLLKDIRKIIVTTSNQKSKMEAYNILLDLMEAYNVKLLSGKVYWEKIEEREKYKKFYEEYEKTETAKGKEILFLKRELSVLQDNEENKEIINFYKERLMSYGAMKKIRNICKTNSNYTRTRKVNK
ncbi:MAG: hypothetical protein J6K45_01275 [Clostridia bacterium]|nr:hypothetical protein [Clostridia bacterium]